MFENRTLACRLRTENAFSRDNPAPFAKIARFDGCSPAQVTKAWGIMPHHYGAFFRPLSEAFFSPGHFYVTRESIPSSFPLLLQ